MYSCSGTGMGTATTGSSTAVCSQIDSIINKERDNRVLDEVLLLLTHCAHAHDTSCTSHTTDTTLDMKPCPLPGLQYVYDS